MNTKRAYIDEKVPGGTLGRSLFWPSKELEKLRQRKDAPPATEVGFHSYHVGLPMTLGGRERWQGEKGLL